MSLFKEKKSFFGRLSERISDVIMARAEVDEELMDELEETFNYAPGPMDSQEVRKYDIGITVADVQGKTYWAAYIMRTPENPTDDE